jgi:hypothetical protein
MTGGPRGSGASVLVSCARMVVPLGKKARLALKKR